jgi:hypothetical protein
MDFENPRNYDNEDKMSVLRISLGVQGCAHS